MSKAFVSTTTCDKCGVTAADDLGWADVNINRYDFIYDLCPKCWPVLLRWFGPGAEDTA